ncbi:MAG: hypothetical protein E7282_05260 [Lachnospiraceae bacterium]|nr:hypothetical protein [Lachnospiraceae bacterium]
MKKKFASILLTWGIVAAVAISATELTGNLGNTTEEESKEAVAVAIPDENGLKTQSVSTAENVTDDTADGTADDTTDESEDVISDSSEEYLEAFEVNEIINGDDTISIDVENYDVDANVDHYDEETLAIVEDLQNAVTTSEEYEKYEDEDWSDYIAVKSARAEESGKSVDIEDLIAEDEAEAASAALQNADTHTSTTSGISLVTASTDNPGIISPVSAVSIVNTVGGEGLTHESQFATSKKIYGIDVSKWDKEINWTKVKNAGVSFVIIRAGNRYSNTGKLDKDPYFDTYMQGAHAVGLKIGVYFFSQDITTTEAKASANFVIDLIDDYSSYISYPVFYDMELIDGGRLDKANLTKSQRTKIWCAFCDTVASAGYTPGVYASYYSYYDHDSNAIDSSHVSTSTFEEKGYYIWLARYNTRTYSSRPYSMWQYSSTGKVSGISTDVDLDVAYVQTKPAKVSTVTETAATTTSMTIGWNKVTYADGYYCALYTSDGTKVFGKSVSTNSITITQLTDGTALSAGKGYTFKVKAYFSGENTTTGSKVYGSYSTGVTVRTLPNTVSNFTVTENSESANGATITWSKSSGATGYYISYKAEGGSYAKLASVTGTSYTIKEFSPKTKYYVRIKPYVTVTGKNIYSSYTTAISFCTKPATVSGITQASTTTNSITINWKAQSGILGYQVYLYDASGTRLTGPITIEDPTVSTYTYSGLTAGTAYSCRVRAYYTNADGQMMYGSVGKISIKTRPGQVTGLKRSKSTYDSTTLTWTKVSGADGYRIYRYDTSTKSWKYLATTTKNSYTNSKLTSAKKYTYRVRAYVLTNSIYGFGSYSSSYESATTATKPKTVTVKANAATSVTLNWSKVSGVSGYRILIYNTSGKLLGQKTTTATTYKVSGLTAGKTYQFYVQPYMKTSSTTVYGAKSKVLSMTTKPAKVTNVTASATSTSSITLSWDKMTGATGYYIYRYSASTGKSTRIGSTKSTSYKISGLSKGKTYRYRVVAYRKYSGTIYKGSASDVFVVSTRTAKATGLTATSVTKNSITLAWSKVTSAKGYRLYCYDASGNLVERKDVKTTSYTFSGLDAGSYTFKVRAYRQPATYRTYAAMSSAYVACTKPAKVDGIGIISEAIKEDGSVTTKISWDAVENATGYRIYSYNPSTGKYTLLGTTTSCKYNIKGQEEGRTAYICVRAYTTAGGKNYYGSMSSQFIYEAGMTITAVG